MQGKLKQISDITYILKENDLVWMQKYIRDNTYYHTVLPNFKIANNDYQ